MLEQRNDVFRTIGEDKIKERNPKRYEEICDYPIPYMFLFVWKVFLELRQGSNEVIEYSNIESYSHLKKVSLSLYDIDIIYRMQSWANSEIAKARE